MLSCGVGCCIFESDNKTGHRITQRGRTTVLRRSGLPQTLPRTLLDKDLLLPIHAVPRLDFSLVPATGYTDLAPELANTDAGTLDFLRHQIPGNQALTGTGDTQTRPEAWPTAR